MFSSDYPIFSQKLEDDYGWEEWVGGGVSSLKSRRYAVVYENRRILDQYMKAYLLSSLKDLYEVIVLEFKAKAVSLAMNVCGGWVQIKA